MSEENIKERFSIGVVISTYNNPRWLEKTLWGYLYQTHKVDEVVIADDGSREETKQLIDSFRDRLPIKHVWHEDRGFQKSEILNKALMAAESDYLIFTDQDCIPRKDFVAVHYDNARKGQFISGGYFKMTMEVSETVTQDDVERGDVFKISWLRAHKQPWTFKMTKLVGKEWFAKLMNTVTTAKSSWNGCNASGWRADMLAINGYNEDMHYGGQDREFGERLSNLGLKSIQMRYSAIVMHLDHKRPYKTKESMERNRAIRRETRRKKIIKTPNGIEKL
ncbi:MAG: glycosyltransferase family 2 protein [Bacteroidales bacterium]|nr:glycosyltransferase family 2 protein [Bacteroidales bacterium]